MIRLLHTADHQLGVKFMGFGEKGKQLRQAVKESLKATVDLALTEAVDLVLIPGDLFDSNAV
ncbi:MAG: phosphoesterase, partial [Deltaproteobacteria bacterium]|nr:phosphoesterase [Deltaproteobacteria bacterium]